uniref:hypothetical protein n=1 Tax=Microbacterium sp. PF5 TaxID=2305435 RepID=UPI00197C739A
PVMMPARDVGRGAPPCADRDRVEYALERAQLSYHALQLNATRGDLADVNGITAESLAGLGAVLLSRDLGRAGRRHHHQRPLPAAQRPGAGR